VWVGGDEEVDKPNVENIKLINANKKPSIKRVFNLGVTVS
jgi:hypothetical protein